MDLIVTLVISLIIYIIKSTVSGSEEVRVCYVNNEGNEVESTVKENKIKVGNNLMLKKENRAFHKILDELGLR